ncbi:MAG TPA: DinB family protein [Acidobacteriaceae bacterium]|nr:DinB family protein [Acidobacteriaceae bacterium]
MTIAQLVLAEFEPQAAATKRFLERLPEDKLTWKPHEKSMTAGQLAYHLAAVPGNVVRAIQNPNAQAPKFRLFQPSTCAEVLTTLGESVATVQAVLPSFDDTAMNDTWRLHAGEQVVLAVPRKQFLRDIMLNHWYQHRGQFSVYLRLLDIPVPCTWGPSADETPAPPPRQEA